MRTPRTLLALALAAALAACATTETPLPAVDLPPTNAAAIPGIDRWWTQFNDPQLTALVEEALAANLDLRIAVARIQGLGVMFQPLHKCRIEHVVSLLVRSRINHRRCCLKRWPITRDTVPVRG